MSFLFSSLSTLSQLAQDAMADTNDQYNIEEERPIFNSDIEELEYLRNRVDDLEDRNKKSEQDYLNNMKEMKNVVDEKEKIILLFKSSNTINSNSNSADFDDINQITKSLDDAKLKIEELSSQYNNNIPIDSNLDDNSNNQIDILNSKLKLSNDLNIELYNKIKLLESSNLNDNETRYINLIQSEQVRCIEKQNEIDQLELALQQGKINQEAQIIRQNVEISKFKSLIEDLQLERKTMEEEYDSFVAELKIDIDEKVKIIQDSTDELNNLKLKNKKLFEVISKFESEKLSINTDSVQTNKEVFDKHALLENISNLESEVSSQEAQLNSYASDINALTTKLKISTEKCLYFESEVDRLSDLHYGEKILNSNDERLNTDFQSADFNLKYQDLQESIILANEKSSNLAQLNKNYEDQITLLKEEYQSSLLNYSSNLETIMIENKGLVDLINSLQDQLNLLKSEKTHFENLVSNFKADSLNSEVKVLNDTNIELIKEVEWLKQLESNSIDQLKLKELDINKQKVDLLEKIEQLNIKNKSEFAANEVVLESLRQDLKSRISELEAYEKNNIALRSRVESLEQALIDKEAELSRLILDNSNKVNVDNLPSNDLVEIELELQAKNGELNRLRSELSIFKSSCLLKEEEFNKNINQLTDKISIMKENETILIKKEREWIDWNKINEEFIIQSSDVLRQIGKDLNLHSDISINTAEDLYQLIASIQPYFERKFSTFGDTLIVNQKLEEALNVAENSKNSAIEQRDQTIKQLKLQYDGVLKQLAKLQASAQDSYNKEEEASQEILKLNQDIQLISHENENLKMEIQKNHAFEIQSSNEDQLKVLKLESEISDLENDLSNSEYLISNLKSEILRVEKQRSLNESQLACAAQENEMQINILTLELNTYKSRLFEAQQISVENSNENSKLINLLNDQIIELKEKTLNDENTRLQRELDLKTTECIRHFEAVNNLHGVLEQLQRELKLEKDMLRKSENEKLELTQTTIKNDDYTALVKKHSDLLSRYEMVSKEYNLKTSERDSFEKEVSKLKQSLFQTMKNFGGDENVVDRRIVIKLLVAYFEHNKPREVLDLMSKILQFSDIEKEKVGLNKKDNVVNKLASYLPSFVSNLPKNIYAAATLQVNQVNQALPKNENGENIADLWVKFLLNEVNSANEQNEKPQPIINDMDVTIRPSVENLLSSSFSITSNDDAKVNDTHHLPAILPVSGSQAPLKTTNNIAYSYPPPMFQ